MGYVTISKLLNPIFRVPICNEYTISYKPDDAMVQIGKTRRNMYHPWLKDLIKLKAFTGRRNAELFAMR
jgi:hypothetical protein